MFSFSAPALRACLLSVRRSLFLQPLAPCVFPKTTAIVSSSGRASILHVSRGANLYKVELFPFQCANLSTSTVMSFSTSEGSSIFQDGTSSSMLGKPIEFSKTKASSTSLKDSLYIPKGKENKYSPFVLLTIGVLICGSILYKMLTTDKQTQKDYFAKGLLGILIEEEGEEGEVSSEGDNEKFTIPKPPQMK
eukprot:m.8146 g.8146  ORF g.8146 m.8146 type:complete len:192 (-) comp3029_c0_seq1:166-741(-)